MNGLKLEPGWRHACVTWLNLFWLKSKPPTSARIAPSCGTTETNAPSTCGICVIAQLPSSFLTQTDHRARPHPLIRLRARTERGLREAQAVALIGRRRRRR